ncbi:hypothetical protein J6590_027913 [Homalodisca vitripennis]|nr:hypothetical protein J6590_027913 [Homalodisca vitripennis]
MLSDGRQHRATRVHHTGEPEDRKHLPSVYTAINQLDTGTGFLQSRCARGKLETLVSYPGNTG